MLRVIYFIDVTWMYAKVDITLDLSQTLYIINTSTWIYDKVDINMVYTEQHYAVVSVALIANFEDA